MNRLIVFFLLSFYLIADFFSSCVCVLRDFFFCFLYGKWFDNIEVDRMCSQETDSQFSEELALNKQVLNSPWI